MQTTPVSEVPDPTDCLRLTPVNLKTLRSPLKQGQMNIETNDSLYKENFNLISRQLQNLLSELDVIYREVGYSNIEISRKEKQIFHNLSNSISKFFDEANAERDMLTKEYQVGQHSLQCMLNAINDPKGVYTIPDLFMRNSVLETSAQAIIDDNCSSPQRTSASLLNKLKTLNNVKVFVMNAYLPKFMDHLSTVMKLRHLMDKVPDMEDQILPANLALPTAALCDDFNTRIRTCKGDMQSLFKFFQEEEKAVFYQSFFSNLTSNCIHTLETLIKNYQEEYNRRLETYKKLLNNLLQIADDLCIDIRSELPNELHIEISEDAKPTITWHAIESLQKSLKKCEYQRQNRLKERTELLRKCQVLWTKLKVPEQQQQKFIENNSDLSMRSLENLANELLKLEEMKKKLIKKLIQESWEKIKEYYKAMSFTMEEQEEFLTSFDNMSKESQSLEDDEHLLEYCESQIEDLKKKMDIYQPIWKLIESFDSLQKDKIRLDESTKDSSRLLARNSHKILLEEERTRKRISRHFPTIVQDLKEKLLQFQDVFGKPFLLNGEYFLDVVIQQEAELLSKYPKSRINMKPPSVKQDEIKKVVPKTPKASRVAGSTRLVKSVDKNKISKPVFTPRSRITIESTKKTNVLLPPPHISVKKDLSRIPTLDTRIGSLNCREKRKSIVKPKQLAPISSNLLNILKSTEKTHQPLAKLGDCSLNSFERNNMNVKDANGARYMATKLPSSPIKEPLGSVYSIIKSPEGKLKLNVCSNNGANNTNNGDSSFLNDDNFIEWKQSQLAKLNNANDENIDWDSSAF